MYPLREKVKSFKYLITFVLVKTDLFTAGSNFKHHSETTARMYLDIQLFLEFRAGRENSEP